jgi:hypothetical protein
LHFTAASINTLIIAILLGAVVVFMVIMMMMSTNKKAVKGHVYVEFMAKTKHSDAMLLIDKGGKVTAPDKYKDVSGGEYFFDADHTYLTLYPPNTMKFLQVPCTKIYFAEGNPNAISPFSELPVLDAQTLEAALNQKFTQLMLNAANEVYDKLESMLKVFKLNPQTLYIIIGIVGVVALASAYLGYENYKMLKAIIVAMR